LWARIGAYHIVESCNAPGDNVLKLFLCSL
jgi:hypothetical protein